MPLVLLWIVAAGCLAAPQVKPEPELHRFEYAGTEMAAPVTIVLYAAGEAVARRASRAAFARIRRLNAILSDYDPESELSRLCRAAAHGQEVPVSADLWRVLTRAADIARSSRGAFDVTVSPVVRLWRRARSVRRLPTPEELERARALVDYRLLRLHPERRSVTLLRAGVSLDLGGIAKGYAASEALKVLGEHGLPRALVDIGGDIALGSPPPGLPGWRIGVAPNSSERGRDGHLWLSSAAVATSGDAEQFVILDGRRYSHIVDPRTGVGLTNHGRVTVVAPDGMTADALASAVSVLGPGAGLDLLESTPGAAGRIVRHLETGRAVHESRRWKSVLVAAPQEGNTPPAKEKSPDPAMTPPVAWLPRPVPVRSADAETAAQMKPYTERIPGSDATFDMVPIPGGAFLIGSPPDEAHRAADEGPRFEIEVEPFWMGKCEVTWREYELWGMGYDVLRRELAKKKNPNARDRLADAVTRPTRPYADMSFGMGKEGRPAVCMTQLAAKMYCKWLSAKTGRYYRLPTEAEWEYACRAGTTTPYSFGGDPNDLGAHAWYAGNSDEKYHEVGQKNANPWGLFDMHGNVSEWVLDRHTPEGYKRLAAAPRPRLVVPETIYPRVVRGGSWMDEPDKLRSASRTGSHEDWKMGDPQIPQSIWYHTDAAFVGFRVVRPLKLPGVKEAARYDLDPAQKKALADHIAELEGE